MSEASPPASVPAPPASVPAGLHIELTRHRVIPGKSDEVDRWMTMLNTRHDECVETLAPERMAIEAIFRLADDDGEWLYWLEIRGPQGAGLDPQWPIDRDHMAFAARAKVPGHETARTELLLMPSPVREAVLRWAAGDGTVAAADSGTYS
jgi:hypothetical protein